MHAPTNTETIEAIKGAHTAESHDDLAERLGVSRNTVRRYRKEARSERQEAARSILAEHVADHLPDALADLHELRRLAGARYREMSSATQGALWLSAIEATLKHVSPDDSELDAQIAAELARLPGAGEAAPVGEAARP